MWAASDWHKLINSLLLALFASEFLRTRTPSKGLLLATLGANGVLSQWGLLTTAAHLALTPHQLVPLTFLALVIALNLGYGLHRWKACLKPASCVTQQGRVLCAVLAPASALLVALQLSAHGWLQAGKVLGGVAVFTSTSFLDVRRCFAAVELSARVYLWHLGVSLLQIVPLYPFLAVAMAPVLLLIVDCVEGFGFHSKTTHEALNELVFDGIFYSPFIAVYILAKWRCLKDPSLTTATPLPTTAPRGKAEAGKAARGGK